jgi:hypothetical protein
MVWCVLMSLERPAYAYVDPGSGLFLLQGISTAFLGLLYVVRRKLKLLWKSKEEAVQATAAPGQIEPEPAVRERIAA